MKRSHAAGRGKVFQCTLGFGMVLLLVALRLGWNWHWTLVLGLALGLALGLDEYALQLGCDYRADQGGKRGFEKSAPT